MGLLDFLKGKQSEEVLESINGITLSDEEIREFGDVVHDYSDIHRDIDSAKKHGFEKIPVIGVHLSAIGGRLSRDLIAVIQKPDFHLLYTGQDVVFRDPIYRGEPIKWHPPEFETDGECVKCKILISDQERGKKPRVEMTSEFTTTWPEFQPTNKADLVYSEDIEFTPGEVERFYECRKEEPIKPIAFPHGIARIPSVLLSLAEKLNELQKTEIGGKNLGMRSQAYGELQTGDARVEVYFVEKSGRGHRCSYTFQGVLYQKDNPVISSTVKSLVNGEFSREAIETLCARLAA